MNNVEVKDVLKGIEVISKFLECYDVKVINVDMEGYTITIFDKFNEEHTMEIKDISKVAEYYADMIGKMIADTRECKDERLPSDVRENVIKNLLVELNILKKLIK